MSKDKGEAPAGWQEEQNHIQNQILSLLEMLRGLKQTLWAPEPRDPTETETELCLGVPRGGRGQQWAAVRAGDLGVVDLGMA